MHVVLRESLGPRPAEALRQLLCRHGAVFGLVEVDEQPLQLVRYALLLRGVAARVPLPLP